MKKSIKENILERLKDKNLYIFLAITLIFFGIFILKDYTVDSYLFFQQTWKEPFKHFASLGRLVSAACCLVFTWTNFDITYIASFLFAIITTTLSIYECNRVLERDLVKEKTKGIAIVTKIIATLLIINISSLELYMFYEKGIMMFSILMNVLAIGQLDKALQGNKKAWIIILLEMFIANCCYQGTVGLLVAVGTIYIIKNSKNIIDFVKNNILVALFYGIPAILDMLIAKFVFHSSRLENDLGLGEKVMKIGSEIVNITKNTFDILPPYLFLMILLGISIFFILKAILQVRKESKRMIIVNLFFLVYVIVATIVVTVAPQIMQAYVYMVPRNVYPFSAILGILLILTYHKVRVGKVANNCIIIGGILLLSIQFYNFIDITKGHYYTNQKDREIAERIATMVNQYEEKTEERITKVVIYAEPTPAHYKNVRYNGDANVRAFYTSWGTRGILQLVLGRELQIVQDKNIEYETFFKSKDWEEFEEEQVKFDKDTLHFCFV